MDEKRTYLSRREFLKLSIVTIAAGFALAACAPQPASPAQSDAPEAPAAETQTTGEIPKGGVVRVAGSAGRTKYFSPLWFIGSVGWDNTMPHVWPGLITFGPNGDPYPHLAERFEIAEDARSVTFYLPKEAKWSDDVPLTAADVKFTYETILTPGFLEFTGGSWGMFNVEELEGGEEFAAGSASEISGIEIVDDHTVRFRLAQPSTTFVRGLWRSIAPKHMYEGAKTFEELEAAEFTQNSTVHSGPFRLVQYVETQFIELEAVRPYWLNLPYLHEANIDKFIMHQDLRNDAALTRMEAGELELALRVRGEVITRAEELDGIEVVSGPALSFLGFGVNGRKEYLKDKRVRQAMMHAMDRNVINVLNYEGKGEPITSPIFAPDWANNPDINPYEHDPAKARALLEEAGWDFNRELTYLSFAEGEDPQAAYVQQAFGEAGIKVQIQHAAFSGFYDIMQEGELDLWSESGYDASHPATAALNFTCGSYNASMAGYCNEELDDLVRQSSGTTDPDKAREIAWQMSQIMNDELPYLWAVREPIIHLASSRLGNYIWSPIGDNGCTFLMYDWYVTQ